MLEFWQPREYVRKREEAIAVEMEVFQACQLVEIFFWEHGQSSILQVENLQRSKVVKHSWRQDTEFVVVQAQHGDVFQASKDVRGQRSDALVAQTQHAPPCAGRT